MLRAVAAGGEHPDATPARLREAIRESKADEKARLLLEGYKEEALRALDGLSDATLKGLLRRLMAKIFSTLAFEGYCREHEMAARPAAVERATSALP